MTINRRNIVTGAALLAAVPTVSAASANLPIPSMSPAFAALVADFNEALRIYREADTAHAEIRATIEDAFESWRPTTPQHRRVFPLPDDCLNTAHHANTLADQMVASNRRIIEQFDAQPGSALYRGHMRQIDEIEACRRDALAYFADAQQRIKASGYRAAHDAWGEAEERLTAAFYALLAAPCNTLDEARAKAAAFIGAPAGCGGELEYEEGQTFLRSILGGEA